MKTDSQETRELRKAVEQSAAGLEQDINTDQLSHEALTLTYQLLQLCHHPELRDSQSTVTAILQNQEKTAYKIALLNHICSSGLLQGDEPPASKTKTLDAITSTFNRGDIAKPLGRIHLHCQLGQSLDPQELKEMTQNILSSNSVFQKETRLKRFLTKAHKKHHTSSQRSWHNWYQADENSRNLILTIITKYKKIDSSLVASWIASLGYEKALPDIQKAIENGNEPDLISVLESHQANAAYNKLEQELDQLDLSANKPAPSDAESTLGCYRLMRQLNPKSDNKKLMAYALAQHQAMTKTLELASLTPRTLTDDGDWYRHILTDSRRLAALEKLNIDTKNLFRQPALSEQILSADTEVVEQLAQSLDLTEGMPHNQEELLYQFCHQREQFQQTALALEVMKGEGPLSPDVQNAIVSNSQVCQRVIVLDKMLSVADLTPQQRQQCQLQLLEKGPGYDRLISSMAGLQDSLSQSQFAQLANTFNESSSDEGKLRIFSIAIDTISKLESSEQQQASAQHYMDNTVRIFQQFSQIDQLGLPDTARQSVYQFILRNDDSSEFLAHVTQNQSDLPAYKNTNQQLLQAAISIAPSERDAFIEVQSTLAAMNLPDNLRIEFMQSLATLSSKGLCNLTETSNKLKQLGEGISFNNHLLPCLTTTSADQLSDLQQAARQLLQIGVGDINDEKLSGLSAIQLSNLITIANHKPAHISADITSQLIDHVEAYTQLLTAANEVSNSDQQQSNLMDTIFSMDADYIDDAAHLTTQIHTSPDSFSNLANTLSQSLNIHAEHNGALGQAARIASKLGASAADNGMMIDFAMLAPDNAALALSKLKQLQSIGFQVEQQHDLFKDLMTEASVDDITFIVRFSQDMTASLDQEERNGISLSALSNPEKLGNIHHGLKKIHAVIGDQLNPSNQSVIIDLLKNPQRITHAASAIEKLTLQKVDTTTEIDKYMQAISDPSSVNTHYSEGPLVKNADTVKLEKFIQELSNSQHPDQIMMSYSESTGYSVSIPNDDGEPMTAPLSMILHGADLGQLNLSEDTIDRLGQMLETLLDRDSEASPEEDYEKGDILGEHISEVVTEDLATNIVAQSLPLYSRLASAMYIDDDKYTDLNRLMRGEAISPGAKYSQWEGLDDTPQRPVIHLITALLVNDASNKIQTASPKAFELMEEYIRENTLIEHNPGDLSAASRVKTPPTDSEEAIQQTYELALQSALDKSIIDTDQYAELMELKQAISQVYPTQGNLRRESYVSDDYHQQLLANPNKLPHFASYSSKQASQGINPDMNKIITLTGVSRTIINQEEAEVFVPPGSVVEYTETDAGYLGRIVATPDLVQADSSTVSHALAHAYDNHLSKPYSVEPDPYPDPAEQPDSTFNINRHNHGLAHTYRKMSHIPHVIDYFAKHAKEPDFKQFCLQSNHTQALDILKVMAAFSVTGRDSEHSHGEDADLYQSYKEASRENLKTYLESLNDSNSTLFTNCDEQTKAELIEDMLEVTQNIGNPNYNEADVPPRRKFMQRILSLSHDLDLLRCHLPEEFANDMANFDKYTASSATQKQSLCELIRYSDQLIKAHGSPNVSTVSEDGKVYRAAEWDTEDRTESDKRFSKASTSLRQLYRISAVASRPKRTAHLEPTPMSLPDRDNKQRTPTAFHQARHGTRLPPKQGSGGAPAKKYTPPLKQRQPGSKTKQGGNKDASDDNAIGGHIKL